MQLNMAKKKARLNQCIRGRKILAEHNVGGTPHPPSLALPWLPFPKRSSIPGARSRRRLIFLLANDFSNLPPIPSSPLGTPL